MAGIDWDHICTIYSHSQISKYQIPPALLTMEDVPNLFFFGEHPED